MAAILKAININIPVGRKIGLYAFHFDTPDTFKFTTGFYVSNNILPEYQEKIKIQIKNVHDEITELMDISFLTPPEYLSRNKKIFNCQPIKAQGRKVIIFIELSRINKKPIDFDFYIKCIKPC